MLGLQLAASGEAEHLPVINEEEPSFCHSLETMQSMWDVAGEKAGLGRSGLVWKVELKEQEIPESHRIGLLSNKKLTTIIWAARLVMKQPQQNRI